MENILRQFFEKLEKFNEEEINAVLEHTRLKSYEKGEIILRQGEICDKCYFLLQGCLRQYQVAGGEEITTGFYLEGQPIVSYSSYLKNTPSVFYLSCIEDSVLLTGTRQQEQELKRKYPGLEHLIHTLMLQDYEKAENYIALLNGYKPEERYKILLKTQPELFNRVPLHHIASFLGVTPESFSRIRKRIMTSRKFK